MKKRSSRPSNSNRRSKRNDGTSAAAVSKRRRGIAIAAAEDKEDLYQEVMWEISPDRSAPHLTGLPPLPPVGSAKGLGLAAGSMPDIEDGGVKARFLSSSLSVNSTQPSDMLSFEEDYTQSALLVDADPGAARKSDEILLLKMDAISAMHEDTRQSSVGSANSCTSEDDDQLRRHVQHIASNVTPVNNTSPTRSAARHEDCFEGALFTSVNSSPVLGRDSLDSCNTTRSHLSVASALPAAADTQCSEDPSQPDFVDSVVNMETSCITIQRSAEEAVDRSTSDRSGVTTSLGRINGFSSQYSVNSSDTGITNGNNASVSEHGNGVGKASETTVVSTMGLDDLSFDVLTQIESMEAQARQNIQQKKSTLLANSKVKSISCGGSSAIRSSVAVSSIDSVTCEFPDFDLSALDALEKSALQDISQKKRFPGEVDEMATYGCNVPALDSITVRRLIALSVSTQFNSTTGQREKLIRCIPSDAAADSLNGAEGNIERQSISTVILRGDDWYEADVSGGDMFNYIAIGESDRPGNNRLDGKEVTDSDTTSYDTQLIGVVSAQSGLLILHPDMLVTPSRISDALSCARKGVLSDRVRGYDGVGLAGTVGTVKHSFIEKILGALLPRRLSSEDRNYQTSQRSLTDGDITAAAEHAIKENMETLLACKAHEADPSVHLQLRSMVPSISNFVAIASSIGILVHIDGPYDKPRDEHRPGSQSIGKYLSCLFFVFDGVVDVEDSVWSPTVGLKGQIDAVVDGHLERRAYDEEIGPVLQNFRESFISAMPSNINYMRLNNPLHREMLHSFYAPLEIKTGKWRTASVLPHRAQTMLYLLMLWLRERNCPIQDNTSSVTKFSKQPPDVGVLVYLGPETLIVDTVSAGWTDLRSLIIARNTQAVHIRKCFESVENPLPPPIKSPGQCSFCFQAAECMTYHYTLEKGNKETAGTPDLFSYSIRGFLNPQHIAYFSRWNQLLDLEASTAVSTMYETWAVPSETVESRGGKCVGTLVLSSCYTDNTSMDAASHQSSSMQVPESSYRLSFLRQWDDIDEFDRTQRYRESSFSIGSKVIMSLERFGSASKYVEPNLCSGTVLGIQNSKTDGIGTFSVEVSVPTVPQRLLGIFKVKVKHGSLSVVADGAMNRMVPKYWRVRLDSDEISFGVATLRTNLLKLFVSPHSPNDFRVYTKNPEVIRANGSSTEIVRAGANATETTVTIAGRPRMRSLLIDLVRPGFQSLSGGDIFAPTCSAGNILGYVVVEKKAQDKAQIHAGCAPQVINREMESLNEGQKECVKKVVCANDYVLMLGMPGTGKTSTVSLIIRTLVARGQRVLVASYTHAAVDHLMLKLRDAGLDEAVMVRLGSKRSVDERLHRYLVDQSSCDNMNTLHNRITKARVVGCTVLSAARHVLLECIDFDWCIMDEAGQISQPAAIGPLMQVDKFLLVGDDYQLPPLVVSTEAKAMGMDVSLFKRLAEAHPHAVISLRAQYRMNSDVMDVSNALIYEHKLFCATSATAGARIRIPCIQKIPNIVRSQSETRVNQMLTRTDWLYQCLIPDNSVVFVDIDQLDILDFALSSGGVDSGDSSRPGSSLENICEVRIVELIMWGFLSCGYDINNVGVISPYRAQVSAIKAALDKRFIDPTHAMTKGDASLRSFDVNTVDKFQGRDMEVTILSTVKNKTDTTVGDLLRDWRRVNVAVTRAQKKLIIIGSLCTMGKIPILHALRETVESRNWVVRIPPDGLSMYRISGNE